MLPWTLKPLWSPLLEMYRTKKFFVVLTQMVSGVTFGLIALSLHLPSFFAVTIALFAIVAFSGATHDVACDGVYMDELNAQEQAKYIGWQGAFYNVAKIIGTGLLVYLAGFLKDEYEGPAEDAVLYSWTVIMIILGVVMFALGIYHTRMLPSGKHAHSVTSFSQSMTELWNVIRNFFTKKHIVYYICFIILYRFAAVSYTHLDVYKRQVSVWDVMTGRQQVNMRRYSIVRTNMRCWTPIPSGWPKIPIA